MSIHLIKATNESPRLCVCPFVSTWKWKGIIPHGCRAIPACWVGDEANVRYQM